MYIKYIMEDNIFNVLGNLNSDVEDSPKNIGSTDDHQNADHEESPHSSPIKAEQSVEENS